MSIEGPVEVELKYRVVDETAAERFVVETTLGPFSAVGGARASQYEDRYLDTRDGALDRAGFSARLRQMHATTVVNVKSTQQSEGSLQRRTELEGPADRTLAPIAWPASPARSLILELCGDVPLVERVMIRQLRRKRRLRAGETTVEVSVDEVDVLSRTQLVDQFVELEIELISGDEGPLLELRDVLDADPELRPSRVSKLQAALSAIYGGRRSGSGRRAQAEAARAERAAATVRSAAAERTAGSERPTIREPAEGIEPTKIARASAAEPAASGPGSVGTSPPILPIPLALAANGASHDDIPTIPLAVDPTAPARAPTPRDASPKRRPKRGRGAGDPVAISGDSIDETPPLTVGRTPGVTADDVVAEAGRKVLRFHLARLIDREDGTRLGEDPEELHAMRVATRRMRAA
ncbi:MAG TPA: CYTH domain-containing protein, partial [Candidatus Saccharimonadales bacterium]|nr:CYTH domain-containing protein [Candidatus Saccharimonadales bacterium]